MSFRFGMDRFKGGNPRVGYDDNGRMLSSGASREIREIRDAPISDSYDNYRSVSRGTASGWRRFFTRGRSDPETSFDRRYEWRSSGRSYEGREGSEEVIIEKRKADGYMVEDRLVYDEKPRFWWLFIVVGLLLIVLGVLNLLFCLDFHWYMRFVAGVMIFITGILGLFHNGSLRSSGWRIYSVVYMIVGLVTSACVVVCLGAIIFTCAHQTIELFEYGTDFYVELTKERIGMSGEEVRVNISSWDTHIWLCYGMDCGSILLLLAAFLVMTSVIIVFDNYYNNNYTYIRQVEPFCEPMLWNPYGQISLGQVMIFFGFIISDSVYGSNTFNYQDLMAPVWAGVPAIICGFFTAVAYKRTHNKDFCWAVVAIILQILNLIASVVCIVIMTYGMYENITTIDENSTMLETDFSLQLMFASVIMFVVADCVALANIFWALAAIIRLIIRACCSSSRSKTYIQDEVVTYRDGDLYPDGMSKSSKVVSTTYPADVPRGYVSDRIVNAY